MKNFAPAHADGLLDELQHTIHPQALIWAAAPVVKLYAYEMRLGSALLSAALHSWLPAGRAEDCDAPRAGPPAAAAVLGYGQGLAAVRQFAAGQARLAGLDPVRVDDLVLAVNELATNTVKHTSGPGTVTIWNTGSEIVCQVCDSGQITSPLAGELRPHPAAAEQGWGLWLVRQVCDLVETQTGPEGTTTRLHIRLAS